MRKIAIRGLLARKVRLALTALAVALGVTLIAGTYIFTDTINKSFDNIFVQSNKGTDVALSPNNDLSGDEDPPPIPGPAPRSCSCPPSPPTWPSSTCSAPTRRAMRTSGAPSGSPARLRSRPGR